MKDIMFNIKKTGIIVLLLAFCLITGCTADKEDKDNKETKAPSEVQTNPPHPAGWRRHNPPGRHR